MKAPSAIVLNMFYTGLGIARSLGARGIRVIGLSAHRGIYGNFTRYAEIRRAPDSRDNPQELLAYLLAHAAEFEGSVVYPTRDDDVLFLDRNRHRLAAHYRLVLPSPDALRIALDKSETARAAETVGVPYPRCFSVADVASLEEAAQNLMYPCVMKPVSAHHWRKSGNWEAVGRRKAIPVSSAEELRAQYAAIARAEPRVLLQEIVPGPDENLWIAACYVDQRGKLVAGFTAQKVIQVPEGFGTGCLVRTADAPDVMEKAGRMLESIGFSGIAEVEFKIDGRTGELKLIEINPRPWDQHRLGHLCGVDLIHIAWSDLTGIPLPAIPKQKTGQNWIAEDVFFLLLLRSLLKRDGNFKPLLRMIRGERMYGIWSASDPLPLLGFVGLRFGPELIASIPKYLRAVAGKPRRVGASQPA
jgi:D-aspartate ligase